LSSIFLDTLAVDLERLHRINQTAGAMSTEQRLASGATLKPIETLVMLPSQRLDAIAGRHREALPLLLRTLLRSFGAMRREGSTLLSYLLFEPAFTQALIELGYEDAMARRGEVVDFLRL
jgi:NTE family protein